MKRKIITGLLALTLVVTDVPFLNCNTNIVRAEEVDAENTNGNIGFQNAALANAWRYYELSVGQDVVEYSDAIDADGNKLEFEKEWIFIDDEDLADVGLGVQFYSKYDNAEKACEDKSAVHFEGAIPVGAFGKYVYKWAAIARLDNNEKFNAAILKNIEVGGKKYTVNAIGDYALDNTEGSTGMCSITIPSSVKTIGKEAFKGAKNLKTIVIQGNVTSVGKDAFKGINKKAVFKIKASAANYKKLLVELKNQVLPKQLLLKG